MNDPRFTRRLPALVARANEDKVAVALLAAVFSSWEAPARSRRGVLGRLLRHAVRSMTGRDVPCDVDDLKVIAAATKLDPGVAAEAHSVAHRLITVFSEHLMEELERTPDDVRHLAGHVLEEVLAELLRDLGIKDLSLRVPTEAGEVDILGFSKDVLGCRIGYVFELKQLGTSGKLVPLREVTRLFGLREALRDRLGIVQGVFVTTTDYTRPAREFGSIRHLSLNNFDRLVEWLQQYGRSSRSRGTR